MVINAQDAGWQGSLPRTQETVRSMPSEPFLIDILNTRQRWTLRGLVVIWLCALAYFWLWWLQSDHWIAPAGMILNSVMMLWTTILPGWLFFFTLRMRRSNPALPLPNARIAMIVTKAPAEPWSVVRQTLEGMRQQDIGTPYDVWLADEDPLPETIDWCNRHGVRISCRKGVTDYHRATWPRRTKCKEGNLAYFYDHWGYRDYDIVAQLDADHIPTANYLATMVRPFADPAVGYVAAPSICDQNIGESWVVRARLFVESTLHGPLQAGYNGGYAPLCIGSHYAVRTSALREIGGLGPDLAEDHSTTLMMNAQGWQGVFAFDAEAHGDGAGSFADSVVQELQWSRSLTNILLGITRRYWGGLTWRKKVEFGFSQAWYPLYALLMLVAYLCPILALVLRQPWVSVDLPAFFLHSSGVSLTCVALVSWMRRQGWLRPVNSRIVSWETVLFQFIRWPWVLLAVTQAVIARVFRKEISFKVTPKGTTGAKPLPLVTILPYLGLAAISALATLIVPDAGEARGYYYFCLLNALTYVIVAAAIIALHVRENRDRLAVSLGRFVVPHIALTALASSVVAAALVRRWHEALQTLIPPAVADDLLYGAVLSAEVARDRAMRFSAAYGGYLESNLPILASVAFVFIVGVAAWGMLHGKYLASPRTRTARGLAAFLTIVLIGSIWLNVQPTSATSRTAAHIEPAGSPVASLVEPTPPTTAPNVTTTDVPIATEPGTTTPASPSQPSLSTNAGAKRFFGAYDPSGILLDTSFNTEHFYTDLEQSSIDSLGARLETIRLNGRVPIVTLEPWPLGPGSLREKRLLSDLAEGKYDSQLRQVAAVFHAYRGQIVVRFAHEMELADVYPWGNGDPQQYIAAYRHVHSLIMQASAADLLWVWSPAGNANAASYYPGDDVVDFVGITLLSAPQFDQLSGAPARRTFDQLMDEKYGSAAAFGKPIVIAELGVSDTAEQQTAWMRDMFRSVTEERYPALRGIVCFNALSAKNKVVPDPPDFRITDAQWRAAEAEALAGQAMPVGPALLP